MFSYFKDGVKNTTPNKTISIEALVKEIKTNNNPTIQDIRNLNVNAADYHKRKKKLKSSLPNITVNSIVSYRSDDHIIAFNGYMYFDIDNVDDAAIYKSQLIKQYKDYISMICVSCSGNGLSILTKIENEIIRENFDCIRQYICNTIFKELNLDPNTDRKSNIWFISYDPDCYFNPSSVISIPEKHIVNKETNNESTKKGVNGNTINIYSDCLPNTPYQYNHIPISEVIRTLKFKTEVPVENRVFDMKPVEYCEVFINPKCRIQDGQKRKLYPQTIHNLVYLNPDADPDYIFSYINWLNTHKTVSGTEMSHRDLVSLFHMVYGGIKKNGILKPKLRIKYFHCNPNTIAPEERKKLSRRMTDMYRIYQSMYKISLAIEILQVLNEKGVDDNTIKPLFDCLPNAPIKITQKAVHDLINNVASKSGKKGIGIKTIKTYWNIEPIDIEEVVRMENEMIEITYVSKSSNGADDMG